MSVQATTIEILSWLGEEDIVSSDTLRENIPGLNQAEAVDLSKEVTSLIHQYCRRNLRQREVRETLFLASSLGPFLHLSVYPVSEVTELKVDGETDTDYILDKDRGVLLRIQGSNVGRRVSVWRGNLIEVDYRGGYLYSEGVPHDLRRAAISLAVFLRESKKRDFSVKSMSVEGVGSVTWLDVSFGAMMPDAVRSVLDYYRDRVPC